VSKSKFIKAYLYSFTRAAILLILFLPFFTYSQNPQWIVYTHQNSGLPGNFVSSIAIDTNNIKWIGTSEGLAKFNGLNWIIYDTINSTFLLQPQTLAMDKENNIWVGTLERGLLTFNGNNWQIFDTLNSNIPSNAVKTICVDKYNNKWIGTIGRGLAKFNDTTWTVYNTTNSGMPSNSVWAFTIDTNNVKWVGTFQDGMARFNDTSWILYNSTNTGQPVNFVRAMTVDYLNNIWIATQFWGLVKFNYGLSQWTIYNSTNSGLPNNNLSSVFSPDNVKYIGSIGLAIYNDTAWIIYNQENSPLPGNYISSFNSDKYGNIWIAAAGGLAVYNQNGIIGINNLQTKIPSDIKLLPPFPNPFNPEVNIRFVLSKRIFLNISIFDITGKFITNLNNRETNYGHHELKWNADNFSSGIYFVRFQSNDFIKTQKIILCK
jgi:ligand-binding sensor domain-containing protein